MKTNWILNKEFDEDDILRIAYELNVPTTVVNILMNRNLKDTDSIKKFLYLRLDDLYDPFLMKDMDKVVDRLHRAIENNERIMIFGDYDADGITSTSLIHKFLKNMSIDPLYFIPNRMDDGYGLSLKGIELAIKNHIDLIITVDCGITGFEQVDFAKKHNIDVIITDHHEIDEKLPNADAIINPHRPDDDYPFKFLAGCGVVFKLIQAYYKKHLSEKKNEIIQFLDFVALGTIADVVPIIDENRILTYFGLKNLIKTNNLGIKALCNVADLHVEKMTSFHIGFVLAPRINAIGRMSDANEAVKLFITENEFEAKNIANKLNYENKKRQKINLEVYEQAEREIEEKELYKNKTIVLAHENWHEGVIGIVASRIVEKYYKPTIMISLNGDIAKGSGRSIPEFHLYNSLKEMDYLLESFGGHKLAAGISIKRENIDEFQNKFEEMADKRVQKFASKIIEIDVEITFDEITNELEKAIQLLAPFGYGNPKPIFITRNIDIIGYPMLFKDRHLRFMARNNGVSFDAIWFNNGKDYIGDMIDNTNNIDIVYYITRNNFQGKSSIQLQIVDMKVNDEINK